MKLYYSPGACSLSPHIALREAGLPVELIKVDLKAKKTEKGDDFLKINPNGYVPALQLDDGSVLTEGPAMIQYIADRKPEAKLAPAASSTERYRLQEKLNYISTELHKGFSPLFNPATPEEYKTMVKDRLALRFSVLDKQLAGKQFVMGDTFTVADAYLFTITNWSVPTKISLDAYPNIVAYRARVAARPAVQAAMVAEGLVKHAA